MKAIFYVLVGVFTIWAFLAIAALIRMCFILLAEFSGPYFGIVLGISAFGGALGGLWYIMESNTRA